MSRFKKPCPQNGYLSAHAELLISSYQHWTGKLLLQQDLSGVEKYRALFLAPFGVVSHGTEDDPVFNYANQTALDVFEMNWSEFTHLASRKSAEPVNRSEREQLMTRVTQYGFIDDYRGIRISATGKRFMIEEATVWNVIDEQGVYFGQAAVFFKCTKL